jgi:Na+-translocating ferredoxin:NAD+ oxidoreductase subunit G
MKIKDPVMKKLDSTLKNMVLSLFLICAVMSAALASVYLLTKEPIANTDRKKINDAISQVVPAFDNIPGDDMYKVAIMETIDGVAVTDSIELYPAYVKGKLAGTAIKSYTKKGFSGFISVMVGILPDGKIFNTKVMEQKETPGLGSKMNDALFHDQFNGKDPAEFTLAVKKDGGDVDAITAATISSRAFCDALNRAYNAYTNNYSDATTGATLSDSLSSDQLIQGGAK